MQIAIVIPTYRRLDGKTPEYLKKAVQGILDQTHTDWKIFLIGDKYINPKEIRHIIAMVPEKKITFVNLTRAAERDNNYPKELLWKFGGVNAVNYGTRMAIAAGFDWIAHLDHDDTWKEDHLEKINQAIELYDPAWICTVANYLTHGSYLPLLFTHKDFVPFEPVPQGLIRSSVCMNYKRLPLFYVDPYQGKNPINPDWLPADAELWKRCAQYLKENKLDSYCVNIPTVFHLEEGFELR